ncbi:MAG: NAD-dependent epimerase/dehydratase family protein [Candidatus Heimdallarchaeota archaeon]
MTSKILITGATGFIGSHLAQSLVEKSSEIRCLIRRSSSKIAVDYLNGLGAELVYGDLLDKESLRKTVEGIDIIFHLGGGGRLGMPKDICCKINIEGTRNLLDVCREQGTVKKFVYVSTCGVLGDIKNPPADETWPYNPENIVYSRAKAEAEKVALSYKDKIPLAVIRFPPVYGPPIVKEEPDRIAGVTPVLMILASIKKGEWRYIGDGKNLIHWVYVDDAVQGLELVAERGGRGEVYIVADEKAVTMEEIVEIAARAMNVNAPKSHIPVLVARFFATLFEWRAKLFGGTPRMSREMVTGFIANRSFDISKAKRELGYKPKIDLEHGMKSTVRWYRENGYL